MALVALAVVAGPLASVGRLPAADAATTAALLGERPFYTFETWPLTDRLELKVNVASGNLMLRSTDVAIRGTGINLAVARYYNSRDDAAGAFGNRWAMGTGRDVRLVAGADGSVTYWGPSRFSAVFAPDGAGGFSTPPGMNAVLTKNLVDGSYELRFKNDEVLGFTGAGALVADTDRNGNRISLAYNGDGTLASMTDTQGRPVTFTYEGPRVHETTDAVGRHTVYSYDGAGNLTQYSDTAQGIFKFSYWDAGGNLNQIVDPRGNSITLEYDDDHRVVAITQGAYTSEAATTRFTYDATSTVQTNHYLNKTTYTHDGGGRVTRTVDALGHGRDASYTPNSDAATTTDALAAVTRFTYNLNNDLESVQSPGADGAEGAKTTFTYDTSATAAHPHLPSTRTDAQGTRAAFAYDTRGNLESTTTYDSAGNPTSAENVTSQSYNPDGTVDTMVDPLGNVTSYGYDAKGNLTSVSAPEPLGAETFTYDALSRVTATTDGAGRTTSIGYDLADRVTKLVFSDGADISYRYDKNGNLESRVDNTGETTFTYDLFNRLRIKAVPNGPWPTYTYDHLGNLTSAADGGGAVTYDYDPANRLIRLTEPDGAATTFSHDDAGRRTALNYPNGVSQTLSYDPAGRVKAITATKDQAILAGFSYTYETPDGGPGELTRTATDEAGNVTTYDYDGLNRLVWATTKDPAGATTADYGYIYDANGNRTQSVVNGTASSIYGYNAANQLVSSGGAGWGSYDGAGNQTSDGTGMWFSYNAKSQTSSITPKGGSALNLAYADVDQTERVQVGNKTVVSGLFGPADVSDASGSTHYTRDNDGNLISQRTASGTHYYLLDKLGSVVGLTDAAGAVVNRYHYDPYGNITSASATAPNPWRFAGGWHDDETGLTKFGARYYDPKIGRWTQQDPVAGSIADPGTLNRYAYVAGDPVNFVDPTGTISLKSVVATATAVVAGAAVAGAACAVSVGVGCAVAVGVAAGAVATVGLASSGRSRGTALRGGACTGVTAGIAMRAPVGGALFGAACSAL